MLIILNGVFRHFIKIIAIIIYGSWGYRAIAREIPGHTLLPDHLRRRAIREPTGVPISAPIGPHFTDIR